MFTTAAFLLAAIIGWRTGKAQSAEWKSQRDPLSDERIREATLHSRQDLQLIVYLLFAILVALGVIADGVWQSR